MKIVEFLEKIDLYSCASKAVVDRGQAYLDAGRVYLDNVQQEVAIAHIQGTDWYDVILQIDDDSLICKCTCPHAARGFICKHMIATILAIREYSQIDSVSHWKNQLDVLLSTQKDLIKQRQSHPYYLFFSLQDRGIWNEEWSIYSYRTINHQIPKDLWEKLQNSDQFDQAVDELHQRNLLKETLANQNDNSCINLPPEAVSFFHLNNKARRLLHEKDYSYHYYSGQQANHYPLGDLLQVMAVQKIPLYIGTKDEPLQQLAVLHQNPVQPIFDLTEEEEAIQVAYYYQLGNLKFTDSITPLARENRISWMRSGEHIFSIESNSTDNILSPLTAHIPMDEADDFFETYLLPIAELMPITGEAINLETYEHKGLPVPCLFLQEEDQQFFAELCFRYGDYTLPYEADLPDIGLHRSPDNFWSLIKIIRQPEFEKDIFSSVSSAASGLKYGKTHDEPRFFELRAHTNLVDFLMFKVPNLLELGFEIFGEEKLKNIRVRRSYPSISLNVTSGTDWFDLNAVVQFDDQTISLKEVRKALKKKKEFIKLADGSIGYLPEDWVKKYKHLFDFAELNNESESLRLARHHITLIDQLLKENEGWQTDESFSQNLNKIKNFSGIKPVPVPETFNGELFPYQKAGYDWLYFLQENHFGGCLADDMGLGKTIQILAFLQAQYESNKTLPPTLIVVPRSLLINWQQEAQHFTPNLRVLEYFGNTRHELSAQLCQADLIVTTYGIMMRDITELRGKEFHYIVLDESQTIKNPLSKTAKASRLLTAHHRLTLTGTPVENNVMDLWSQFAFLNPGLLGNLEYFKSEFGNPIANGNIESVELLRQMVYPFIMRRTKQQVMPELPEKTERIIYTDMEPAQRHLYEKTRDQYRNQLLGLIEKEGIQNARMKVLEGLLRLRQIANHPLLMKDDFRGNSAKFELLLETLETLQNEGHKVLVFSQFVKMLKLVRKELDVKKIPYLYLDGSTRKRQERVDQFQTDNSIPFFLISLKAGGTGLNLTSADYVIHIDPWWNPAVEAQAADRTHRIGQHKPVFVYKLIARNTVEEKIVELQERKKELVEKLITNENSFFKNLTQEDVAALFE